MVVAYFMKTRVQLHKEFYTYVCLIAFFVCMCAKLDIFAFNQLFLAFLPVCLQSFFL